MWRKVTKPTMSQRKAREKVTNDSNNKKRLLQQQKLHYNQQQLRMMISLIFPWILQQRQWNQKKQTSTVSHRPTNCLLVWHYCLNHVPFSKLQAMARRSDIPKTLSECSVPLCASCNYAKATRRPGGRREQDLREQFHPSRRQATA